MATSKATSKALQTPASPSAPRPSASVARVPKAGLSADADAADASRSIDERIASLDDWRGEMLARVRAVIRKADPEVVEEWKWRGTPVWSDHGIVCTGESYKQVVKLTFAKGAFLSDPTRLFNASLDGNVRRAIDIREADTLDEAALAALFLAGVALNRSAKRSK